MKLIMIWLVIRKREPTVVGWNSIIDSVACKQPEYTPCPLIQSVKNRAIACRTPTLSFSHLRSRLWLVQKRTWFVTVYLIGLLRILFRSVIGGIEGLWFSQSESTSQMWESPLGFDKLPRARVFRLNYRVYIHAGCTQDKRQNSMRSAKYIFYWFLL